MRTRPNPLFDGGWYLKNNPDVAGTEIDPLVHYITSGSAENRWPHPLFDPAWYWENNADVQTCGAGAFGHYLLFGKDERRVPMPEWEAHGATGG